MSTLHFYLLGAPLVRWGDEPLRFATRKALALLLYLVLEEEMQPRERLATLFWPESSPRRARANLRNTLAYLRGALPSDAYLHVERDALGFNRAAPHTLDLNDVAGVAADALSLVRGDFLAGFNLGDAPDFDE